jgi:hypothetical protein
VENRNSILHVKYLFVILSLLFVNCLSIFGQKKSYIIGIDKLSIDANDPLYHQVKPGDTLCFSAGNRKYLNIANFEGNADNPIVMINHGGEVIIDTDHFFGISIKNCRFIKLTGTGYPGVFYGFKIKKVTNGTGVGIGSLSTDFEIDHISIENTSIAGMYAKTDPDCSLNSVRGKFTQYNTVIHDNYIANTGDEGIYAGSTKYTGQTVKCNGKDTLLMPSLLDGVKIYNNIIKFTGWDGIQVSSASKNCQIYDNTIVYDSQDNHDTQMSGIMIGGGTKCDCYGNFISQGNGDGIDCLGLGGTRIFNNIILDAGQSYYPNDRTKMKHGIFVSDNSVQKDSSFYVINNNIIHPKSDGIRFSSVITKDNFISANVIIDPANFDYYENGNTRFKGKDAYIMFQTPGSKTTVSDNYLARDATSAGFSSQKMQLPADFALVSGSPLIDAVDFNAKTALTFDFLHHPRPTGLKSDIGALEYGNFVSSVQLTPGEPEKQSWIIQNPVTDFLKVGIKQTNNKALTLKIYNMTGALEMESNQFQLAYDLQVFEVDVAKLESGIYVYIIGSQAESFSGKFIKL